LVKSRITAAEQRPIVQFHPHSPPFHFTSEFHFKKTVIIPKMTFRLKNLNENTPSHKFLSNGLNEKSLQSFLVCLFLAMASVPGQLKIIQSHKQYHVPPQAAAGAS
jgi:hypothetical protein